MAPVPVDTLMREKRIEEKSREETWTRTMAKTRTRKSEEQEEEEDTDDGGEDIGREWEVK